MTCTIWISRPGKGLVTCFHREVDIFSESLLPQYPSSVTSSHSVPFIHNLTSRQTQDWVAVAATGAPSARTGHSAVVDADVLWIFGGRGGPESSSRAMVAMDCDERIVDKPEKQKNNFENWKDEERRMTPFKFLEPRPEPYSICMW